MPAYLVELPSGAHQLVGGFDRMVVFAANEAGARAAAAGMFDGDGNALWNSVATVTEVVAGTLLSDSSDGWSAYCRVTGGAAQTVDPIVANVDGLTRDVPANILSETRLHLNGVLNSGGVATYVVDDILTATGGTFTRAATFRVITVSTGVITAIELVDPGEYTVLPPTLTANPVSGGGGSGATVDLTQFAPGSYEAILAQMVTDLNTVVDLGNAALDLSEGASGARLLTIATIPDNIGDATVEFEVRHNSVAFAPLVSTITDGGIAGAVLTVAIPASPLAPPRVIPLKSV